jgi:hypothetical protein
MSFSIAGVRRVCGVPQSQLPQVLQFISHGDAAAGIGTHQRLGNVDCPAVAPTPAWQALTVKSMSQHSPYMYSFVIQSQLFLLFTVCIDCPITPLSRNKMALLRNFTPFDGDVYHEK